MFQTEHDCQVRQVAGRRQLEADRLPAVHLLGQLRYRTQEIDGQASGLAYFPAEKLPAGCANVTKRYSCLSPIYSSPPLITGS